MSMEFGMGNMDLMFTLFPLLFGATFIIIFGIILVVIVKGIGQWHKNNESPVLTVSAEMVTKRTSVSHHSGSMNDDMHSHSSTSYYATFQVESGDRIEFAMAAQEYGLLVEGDEGKLTFQGTRYHGFKRER